MYESVLTGPVDALMGIRVHKEGRTMAKATKAIEYFMAYDIEGDKGCWECCDVMKMIFIVHRQDVAEYAQSKRMVKPERRLMKAWGSV